MSTIQPNPAITAQINRLKASHVAPKRAQELIGKLTSKADENKDGKLDCCELAELESSVDKFLSNGEKIWVLVPRVDKFDRNPRGYWTFKEGVNKPKPKTSVREPSERVPGQPWAKNY